MISCSDLVVRGRLQDASSSHFFRAPTLHEPCARSRLQPQHLVFGHHRRAHPPADFIDGAIQLRRLASDYYISVYQAVTIDKSKNTHDPHSRRSSHFAHGAHVKQLPGGLGLSPSVAVEKQNLALSAFATTFPTILAMGFAPSSIDTWTNYLRRWPLSL